MLPRLCWTFGAIVHEFQQLSIFFSMCRSIAYGTLGLKAVRSSPWCWREVTLERGENRCRTDSEYRQLLISRTYSRRSASWQRWRWYHHHRLYWPTDSAGGVVGGGDKKPVTLASAISWCVGRFDRLDDKRLHDQAGHIFFFFSFLLLTTLKKFKMDEAKVCPSVCRPACLSVCLPVCLPDDHRLMCGCLVKTLRRCSDIEAMLFIHALNYSIVFGMDIMATLRPDTVVKHDFFAFKFHVKSCLLINDIMTKKKKKKRWTMQFSPPVAMETIQNGHQTQTVTRGLCQIYQIIIYWYYWNW